MGDRVMEMYEVLFLGMDTLYSIAAAQPPACLAAEPRVDIAHHCGVMLCTMIAQTIE